MTNDNTMPIIRELLFINRRAYSITDTMGFMNELKDRTTEEEFPTYVYESIMATLIDQKYLIETDEDEFIPDPLTGTLTLLDLWLMRWGVQDRTFDYFDGTDNTIQTFDMEMSEDDEEEECIADSDEEELVIGAHILLELDTELPPSVDVLYEDDDVSEVSV